MAAMQPAVLAQIVSDARLTPQSVRVILHVALLGEGEQHVKNVELSILVGGGEKPIRSAIELAVHCGYLKADRGGRVGHKLTFVQHESLPLGSDSPMKIPPVGEGFAGNASAGGVIRPLVVEEDGDVVNPPSPPMLDERTEGALSKYDAQFTGCRGALRDYLLDRVALDRRYAFVQAVGGWFNGTDASVWRFPTGASLPPLERPLVLAAALNELAASERKMKAPTGDPANVKTKINILLKQRARNDGTDSGSPHRGRTQTAGRAASGGAGDYDHLG